MRRGGEKRRRGGEENRRRIYVIVDLSVHCIPIRIHN
jgi:hypothetical protein